MAAPVPGSQRRVIMFGHMKDFLAATGITRNYIVDTGNQKEMAAAYARPGVLMGEVGREGSNKFEPVDQYGVVKAGPERLVLTDVAEAVAPFAQDMDRCVHIGRPKTSPCCEACGCWRNAIEAAVAVITVIRRKGKPVGGGAGIPVLVGCQISDCATEISYTHTLDLVALWEGKPICQDCFDELGPFWVGGGGGDDGEEDIKWSDLPPVTLDILGVG